MAVISRSEILLFSSSPLRAREGMGSLGPGPRHVRHGALCLGIGAQRGCSESPDFVRLGSGDDAVVCVTLRFVQVAGSSKVFIY